MKNFIVQVILFVCFTFIANAQKFITLSLREQKSGKAKVIISEGNRVKCRFVDGAKIVGVVDKIMVDSIQINEKLFLIDNIKSMAKREKGSTAIIMGIQIVPALGGAISSAVGNLPLAICFLVVQVVGHQLLITPLYDYPLRNVKNRWALDVHD